MEEDNKDYVWSSGPISTGNGSYFFWYRTEKGYKSACNTNFTRRNKKIKRIWFKIKLWVYKLTHNTNYRPSKDFKSINLQTNRTEPPKQ